MLSFDDDAHKFQVVPQSPQLTLEFGSKLFFTSLTTGLPAAQLEASLATDQAAFNSPLVFPALLFFAKAVALVPRGANASAAEAQFRRNFEFGFVQGTRFPSVHLEYWGKTGAAGRSIVHIDMPLDFEVDTDPMTQPWTRIASSRFKVTNETKGASGPLRFKVEAEFQDHPMLILPHTIGRLASERFLRSITFTRDFRTIFCYRDKSDSSFNAISATRWTIPFNHFVSYTGGGSTRNIDNRVGPPNFPSGGSPSDVQLEDHRILSMAKSGSPIVTVNILNTRMKDPGVRTETDETPNADFDPAFWKS